MTNPRKAIRKFFEKLHEKFFRQFIYSIPDACQTVHICILTLQEIMRSSITTVYSKVRLNG